MKITVAGPVAIEQLADLTGPGPDIEVHRYPLTAQLARYYRLQGNEVQVIVQSRSIAKPIRFGTPEFSVAIVPVRKARKVVADWFAEEVAWVRAEIERFHPDVVHAHWTYEYARAAVSSSVPHLVTAHDVPGSLWGLMRPRYYWWPKLMQSYWVARNAKNMTAQSEYTLEQWKKMRKDKAMELIPNGVESQILDLHDQFPFSGDGKTFMAANSGFSKGKNVQTLLKAFDIVRSKDPSVRMVLFGPEFGPGEAAEKWSRELGIQNGIEFFGPSPHFDLLKRIAVEASVFVHPSLEESFGMAVAESMALGKPVVGGSKSGAIPWLLDHGKAGIVCDVLNPVSLAEAMTQALTWPELGQVARNRISKEFTFEKSAATYLQLLNRIATSRVA